MGNRSVVNYDGDGLPVVLAPGEIVKREDGLWEVVGEPGPMGPQGEVGPQGVDGVAGDVGPQGVAGATGPQGVAGRDAPMSVVWQDQNNRINPLIPAGRQPAIEASKPVLRRTSTLPMAVPGGPTYRYWMGPNGTVAEEIPVTVPGAGKTR